MLVKYKLRHFKLCSSIIFRWIRFPEMRFEELGSSARLVTTWLTCNWRMIQTKTPLFLFIIKLTKRIRMTRERSWRLVLFEVTFINPSLTIYEPNSNSATSWAPKNTAEEWFTDYNLSSNRLNIPANIVSIKQMNSSLPNGRLWIQCLTRSSKFKEPLWWPISRRRTKTWIKWRVVRGNKLVQVSWILINKHYKSNFWSKFQNKTSFKCFKTSFLATKYEESITPSIVKHILRRI